MTKKIFIDIETLPPVEEFREKIVREVEKELTAQDLQFDQALLDNLSDRKFRDLALQGEYGRLLAIGIIIEQGDTVLTHGVFGRNSDTRLFHLDEKRTLQSFWKLMKDFDPRKDILIGHNLLDFDLRFICKRSIVHGVHPSVTLSFARYRSRPIFDTMWEWSKWGHRVKLTDLAAALGLSDPKANGVNGSNVYDNFVEGRHEEIAHYCMRDVEAVREIYYRINFLEAPALESYESKNRATIALPEEVKAAA